MSGYTTTIGTTTVHVIGKCPVKGCKNRRRVTIPNAPIKRGRLYTWTEWQIPAAAPYNAVPAQLSKSSPKHGMGCARPSQYLAINRHPFDTAWFGAVEAAGWICVDHDRFMVVVEVKGVVNAEKPCTAACKGATGPSCECVCGGDGHGANWGAA
jgi:hypothetical protein